MSEESVESVLVGPSDFQQRLEESGLVFTPRIQMPKYVLGALQMMARGGLDLSDDVDEWETLMEAFDEMKFTVSADHAHLGSGFLTSTPMAMTSFFGAPAAFRIWCAIFEEAVSSWEVDFSGGSMLSRGAVSAELTRNGESKGWDSKFQGYHDLTVARIRRALDRVEEDEGVTLTDVVPNLANLGPTAAKLLKRAAKHGSQALLDYYLPDWVDGRILDTILKSDQSLLSGGSTGGEIAIGGYGVKDMTNKQVEAWGQRLDKLYRSEIGHRPTWPLPSSSRRQLERVTPMQGFGSIRNANTPYEVPHKGLDLTASPGDSVVAVYGGKISEIGRDGNKDKYGRGNFVVITTETERGLPNLETEYLHLAEVDEGLSLGDEVRISRKTKDGGAVEVISPKLGEVGSTGNSTGPHLHVGMSFVEQDEHGRPRDLRAVDPAEVFEEGAVDAALSAGIAFTEQLPTAAIAGANLAALVDNRSAVARQFRHADIEQISRQMQRDFGGPVVGKADAETTDDGKRDESGRVGGGTGEARVAELVERAAESVGMESAEAEDPDRVKDRDALAETFENLLGQSEKFDEMALGDAVAAAKMATYKTDVVRTFQRRQRTRGVDGKTLSERSALVISITKNES